MSIAKIIRIKTTPHGAAPEWVRVKWLGCTLPTAGFECGHILEYVQSVRVPERKGLMSAKEFLAQPGEEKIDGFSVLQDLALMALYVHSPIAARWFFNHGFPRGTYFRFKLAEVEVIRIYTEEELRAFSPVHVANNMEPGTVVAT